MVVVDVSSEVVEVDEESSSLLLQEMTVRLKRDMRIMYKTLLIFSSIPKVKYGCFVIGVKVKIKVKIIARFGIFYKEVGGFTWRVPDCEELVVG